FRVAVFAPDGTREQSVGGGGGFGPGGGPGRGRGAGAGRLGPGGGQGGFGPGMGGGMGGGGVQGSPGGALVERVLKGQEREAVGEYRRGGEGRGADGRRGSRVAAAVRRANGGAILVNADATEIDVLLREVSLDRLIESIAADSPQVAYVVLDRGTSRHAHGSLPVDMPGPGANTTAGSDPPAEATEREAEVAGRPVLELTTPVAFGQADAGVLRLGLRLDEVRAAERRMVTRMAVSLAAALLLSVLALGTIWLRQAYSALSEKHARAEAALRRRDRLSAMGELASTVAHEVRNPLNAIAMSAQRLRREFLAAVAPAGSAPAPAPSEADRAELEQLLHVVEGETGRINDIVQQFLAFARPPHLAPMRVGLGAEVRALVDAARPLAGSREVALEADTAAAGDAVVDAGQLRQAIDNIVRNAIEATPPGGRVAVVARTGGKEHTIEVSDTGAGIGPDDLPKIFDLYFTTKPEGTGIGLAVTQQIVAAHGGTIEVDSSPGTGTRMTIRLPSQVDGATDA
ncbi:MAG TPA: HAMP domain-containing sensor histidine kinase, partial [Vicinamibacterales bacterium]|nr:HAMP domain-containing sensor histidine kinase [Vicinamibacterales bacterium]